MITETTQTEAQQAEQLLIRQYIYQLLAALFYQFPNKEKLEWLAALSLEEQEAVGMPQAWADVKKAAATISETQVAEEYQNIFIGIGHGEVIPFASWYLTGSLMEKPLIGLREDLRMLGLERQQQIKEPEDHIAALLEVMSMLVAVDDFDNQQQFFNRHLGSWFEKFCLDLKQAPSAQFYAAVASLALNFLTIEKVRFTPN